MTAVPDISMLHALPGDVVLLATDGVMDVLSGTDAMGLALHGLAAGGPVEAAADVVWSALQSKSQDNVTCAVIRLAP